MSVGPIRARDLRVNIKELGFENGVVTTLEAALEEIGALRTNMRDAAALMSDMMVQMDRFLAVTGGMRTKIDMIEQHRVKDIREPE